MREPEGAMAARVARHVEHLGFFLAEIERVALGQRHVDARDAGAVGQGPDNYRSGGSFQFEIAAGVVVVVVGVKDMGELPAQLVERRYPWPRYRGIDRRDRSGFGLAQQI